MLGCFLYLFKLLYLLVVFYMYQFFYIYLNEYKKKNAGVCGKTETNLTKKREPDSAKEIDSTKKSRKKQQITGELQNVTHM